MGKTKVESDLLNYSQSHLKKRELLLATFAIWGAFSAIFFVFYRDMIISGVLGVFITPFMMRNYIKSAILKRKRRLRLQFKDMVESLGVSVRAGNNETMALRAAVQDLKMTYSQDSDILRETQLIIEKYENGVPLRVLFTDFGERSGIEDIKSFAQIFAVIEGRSNRFGDIIHQTQQIISDKIEIEDEIETAITSSKSEQNIMFFLPVVLMLAMSTLGGSFMDMLFETLSGKLYVTISVAIFLLAYFIAQKVTDIKV